MSVEHQIIICHTYNTGSWPHTLIKRELKSYKHIFPMQTNEFIQTRIHFIAEYINILIKYGLIAKSINVNML